MAQVANNFSTHLEKDGVFFLWIEVEYLGLKKPKEFYSRIDYMRHIKDHCCSFIVLRELAWCLKLKIWMVTCMDGSKMNHKNQST